MATAKQLAIKGKALIDGNGGPVVADPIILLEGERIAAVGSKDQVKIPHGVEVVDASHCTLMPGMMDLHIHLCMFNNRTFKNYRVAQWEVTPHLQQMYAYFHSQLCFEMGFTTLRDLGQQSTRGLMTEFDVRGARRHRGRRAGGAALVVGAFTYMTGSHLELIFPRAAERHGFQNADGPWELRKLARTNLRAGCDVIKTCASGGGGTDKEEPDVRNHTQEELDAMVDEAHALHKQAAVHCFTPGAHRMALKAGATPSSTWCSTTTTRWKRSSRPACG